MVVLGYEVDFLTSIALIVVVGLSVDYTVHLVHVYNHSNAPTRSSKVRECLVVMAVSVVSGAATTFFAAVSLWSTSLQFFRNFGIFMTLTVVLSLIFSLVILMALLSHFGPQPSDPADAANGPHSAARDPCLPLLALARRCNPCARASKVMATKNPDDNSNASTSAGGESAVL